MRGAHATGPPPGPPSPAAVDAIGPSAEGAEPTRLEEWARTARDRWINRILLALALVLVLAQALLFVFGRLFVGQA